MSLEPVTIYIRGLPVSSEGGYAKKEADEDIILTFCGNFANIDPINVSIKVKNNYNGAPISYGFIQVKDRQEADKLLSKLNFKKVKKEPMHLVIFDEGTQEAIKNEDGKAIVITNINPEFQVSDLYNTFNAFGDVIDCHIPKNPARTAYVLFRDHESADRAIKRLNGTGLNSKDPVQIELDHQNTFAKLFVLPGVSQSSTPAPATPVEEPAAPVEEPAAPVEEPAAPVEEPAAPVEEPAAPVEEPAAPVEEPAAPVEEPAAPVEEPEAPVEEPAPVEQQAIPIEEPSVPAPIEEPAPVEQRAIPVEDQPAPVDLVKENERLTKENLALKAKLEEYERQKSI
ncbi:hypothetical protein M9Y10_031863 [Tritrichomonas musculus]|uniref:RRM domain-containing protein n=1 Tax=Tritrichomonas musculus TaxID=1915356 RepID=A0ABR2H023_9EUKA